MDPDTIKNILIQKGVTLVLPESVFISEDVDPDRVSGTGVIIHPNCRITGRHTLIADHAVFGQEAPVTLDNCQIGESCRLNGGFFQHCVCAGNNTFGSCAHVRKGTILEEQANAAHSVGLKQTILFPFVTLGSQINFCDCLMAGGTSRTNHSEVGSSFVHFNYTPNQDKATASLIGNVHHGVFLDQPAVFLGGQGGLVGPCRIGFGNVTAAGCVIRKDELRSNRILLGGTFKDTSIPARPGVYSQVRRIFNNNVHYLAALIVLRQWYMHARPLCPATGLSSLLLTHMNQNLEICFLERIKRFKDFNEKLDQSKKNLLATGTAPDNPVIQSHDQAMMNYQKTSDLMEQYFYSDFCNSHSGEQFLTGLSAAGKSSANYIDLVQNLDTEIKHAGKSWMTSIHDTIIESNVI